MVLHWAEAWTSPLSARQCRILNSIERKFLLNISVAYSISPTSTLQVIEMILPLSLKAEQEATYVRLSRVNKISYLHNHSFCPADYEPKICHNKFHPAEFNLEEKSPLTYPK
ncbi:hypothetical protein AVEN_144759-1 [Araneus ventricosus]|uniref:Uncharacterized protein n=1 Tax=Araneus ventricosus TaxID=182803 RepID=A0A4Y2JKV8_ARAVE|nr:hypothetical protein AVEN_144759-1 [Araneus ventricosus]